MHKMVCRIRKADSLLAAQHLAQPLFSRTPFAALQRGVSLLEVLIAMLVLAVGMLGAAALQLNALRYNTSAAHVTQASFIAYDMLDRMRANADNLTSYSATVDSCPTLSSPLGTISATDLADFAKAIGCQLPDGVGVIGVNDNRATITIGWSEARILAGEPDTKFVVSSLIRSPNP